MKINNTNYRIKEKIYKDGHKEYIAQYAINCLFFNIWRDYVCDVWDYGYDTVNFICCGKTYEDCKQHLIESIEKNENEYKKKTIDKIKYYD